ncbi:MAG: hypothetical protein QXV17_06895 [Candidatus Micrarchaeaceae archaeon]
MRIGSLRGIRKPFDRLVDLFERRSPVNEKWFINIVLNDADGRPIKMFSQEVHSFVGNWAVLVASMYNVVYGNAGMTPSGIIVDFTTKQYINPTVAVPPSSALPVGLAYTALAPSGDQNYGILVGNGGGGVGVEDQQLVQQILNGTSTGQLQYGSVTVGSVNLNPTSNTATFSITRSFTNNSGGSITVTEVGLALKVAVSSNYVVVGSGHMLVAHDFLSQSVTVANGQSLTVTYTYTLTA